MFIRFTSNELSDATLKLHLILWGDTKFYGLSNAYNMNAVLDEIFYYSKFYDFFIALLDRRAYGPPTGEC